MLKIVDSTDFEKEVIYSQKPVLVDFWAEWCGPCRFIGPIVDQIAREQSDFDVAKLNVDENPQTAAGIGILGIPTLILYSDGEEVLRITGAQPKTDILNTVKNALLDFDALR